MKNPNEALSAGETYQSYELSNTIHTHQDFFKTFNAKKTRLLDSASKDIKFTEHVLTESKIEEEFEWEKSGLTAEGFLFCNLSWRRDSHGKFRLQLASINFGEKVTTEWKPLIECKAEQRLEVYKLLPEFMNAFQTNLKDKLDADIIF